MGGGRLRVPGGAGVRAGIGLMIMVICVGGSVLPPHIGPIALIGVVIGAIILGSGVCDFAGGRTWFFMTTTIIGALFGMALLLASETLALTAVGKTAICAVTQQRTETTSTRSGPTHTYVHTVNCPRGRHYEISTTAQYRHSTGPAAVLYDPNNLLEPDFARRPSTTQGLIWLGASTAAIAALAAFALRRRYQAATHASDVRPAGATKPHNEP